MGKRVNLSEIRKPEDFKKYDADTVFMWNHHEKTVKVPSGYDPETLQSILPDKKQDEEL